MTSTTERNAALAIIMAVAETIRESSPTPAGQLYAALMARGCTLEQFESIVRQLEGAGLVKRNNNQLMWTGPRIS